MHRCDIANTIAGRGKLHYGYDMPGRTSLISSFLLTLLACTTLSGCGKLKDAARDLQPGKAFLDSRIPSGLSPQYFPPEGFVWGAYRAGHLPEARYGVASPPVNPKAQVLILSDADFPAETYFELVRQLVDQGYGVWLLEIPGQGGAGHYLLQNNSVFTPNYRDGQTVSVNFIRDVIHPSADKPLLVLGTGYSAVTALSLSALMRDTGLDGFIAYNPYLGGPIAKGAVWHADSPLPGYWGGVAQTWQMSNPDLRMRVKSDNWQKQMQKAWSELNGLHLPVVSLKSSPQTLVFEPEKAQMTAARGLCARLSNCAVQAIDGPDALGDQIGDMIRQHGPQ